MMPQQRIPRRFESIAGPPPRARSPSPPPKQTLWKRMLSWVYSLLPNLPHQHHRSQPPSSKPHPGPPHQHTNPPEPTPETATATDLTPTPHNPLASANHLRIPIPPPTPLARPPTPQQKCPKHPLQHLRPLHPPHHLRPRNRKNLPHPLRANRPRTPTTRHKPRHHLPPAHLPPPRNPAPTGPRERESRRCRAEPDALPPGRGERDVR